MLNVFKRLFVPALIVGSVASANAITWEFANTGRESIKSEKISWASLTIVNISPDTVALTLTNNAPRFSVFISDLWLNLSDTPPDLAADFSGPIHKITWDKDSMANTGHSWDLNVDFFKNSAQRLNGGDSVTWTMTGSGLDEADFNPLSTKRGPKDEELGMIHLQGMRKGGSSKVFIDGDFAAVPEPASMAVLGLGTLLLARRRLRR